MKQESIFWYRHDPVTNTAAIFSLPHDRMENIGAFTVAELGEMLPEFVKDGFGTNGSLTAVKLMDDGGWRISYLDHQGEDYARPTEERTEANARAKMLVYLIENKLVTRSSPQSGLRSEKVVGA